MEQPIKSEVIADTKADGSSQDNSSLNAQVAGDKGVTVGPHGQTLDQAYWYIQEAGHHGVENTNINMQALRRKIDWCIVPIMFCCYTMQFIDKVSLNVCIRFSCTVSESDKPLSMPLSWVCQRNSSSRGTSSPTQQPGFLLRT